MKLKSVLEAIYRLTGLERPGTNPGLYAATLYKLEDLAAQILGIAPGAQISAENCVEGHIVSKLCSVFIRHLPIHLQRDHFLRGYLLARPQPLQALHGN